MTSMTKLDRRALRWIRYVKQGSRSNTKITAGLWRIAFRLDREKLRRNLLHRQGDLA